MFTNRKMNTLVGLFYAASQSSSPNPNIYGKEFRDALNSYFLAYPNMDYDESSCIDGDDPVNEAVGP